MVARFGVEAVVMLPCCQQRYVNRGTVPVKSCAFGGLSESRGGWKRLFSISWGTLSPAEKSPCRWLPAWAVCCLLAVINPDVNLAFL